MHRPVPFWRVDGISTVLSVRIEVLALHPRGSEDPPNLSYQDLHKRGPEARRTRHPGKNSAEALSWSASATMVLPRAARPQEGLIRLLRQACSECAIQS
ncbi:hypothetical protein AB1N83_011854 [Pleurotus pulmonarius]